MHTKHSSLQDFRKYLNYLLKHLDKMKIIIVVLVLIEFILLILSITNPLIISWFIDGLIEGKPLKHVLFIVSLFLFINLSQRVTSYFFVIFKKKSEAQLVFNLLSALHKKMSYYHLDFFKKNNSAYLTDRLQIDIVVITAFFLGTFIKVFSKLIHLVFIVVIIINLNYKMIIAPAVLLVLYSVLFKLYKRKIFDSVQKLRESQNIFTKTLFHTLDKIYFIQSNSLYSTSSEMISENYKDLYKKNINNVKVKEQSLLFTSLLKSITITIIMIISAIAVLNKTLTVGEFTIIQSYILSTFTSFDFFFGVGRAWQATIPSMRRITEYNNNNYLNPVGKIVLNKIERITLESIDFFYNPDQKVINNVSLDFKTGNVYCLKDTSGKGKTTLINLLIGLIPVNSGTIKINNRSIYDLDIDHLKKNKVAYLEQNCELFFDNIDSILNCGNDEGIDNQILEHLITKFKLHPVITRERNKIRNNKLEIPSFSGGEKQRICLCRVLSKLSNVVILDEPTTGLDCDNKEVLYEMIKILSSEKIIIIVSHDPGIWDIASEELILDRGAVYV